MDAQIKLRQDNRLTNARYELTLSEKRIIYLVVREVRKKYYNKNLDKTLFENFIVRFNVRDLRLGTKLKQKSDLKKALKTLRLRSFEWTNNISPEEDGHEGLELGFINYHKWEKGGNISVEVSNMLLPYLVELTSQYTEFSLVVAMSLKSIWSQRLYELMNKWKNAGGFQISINELRYMFKLEKKYSKYAALKRFVIEQARKELKALFDKGQSDLYFEYSEIKSGRSVNALKFKIITNQQVIEPQDMDYFVRVELNNIFETKNKPANKEFVDKFILKLRLNPDDLKKFFNRLQDIKQNIPRKEIARYTRYIINEDYLKD